MLQLEQVQTASSRSGEEGEHFHCDLSCSFLLVSFNHQAAARRKRIFQVTTVQVPNLTDFSEARIRPLPDDDY